MRYTDTECSGSLKHFTVRYFAACVQECGEGNAGISKSCGGQAGGSSVLRTYQPYVCSNLIVWMNFLPKCEGAY